MKLYRGSNLDDINFSFYKEKNHRIQKRKMSRGKKEEEIINLSFHFLSTR
jgi:hypothetical protein